MKRRVAVTLRLDPALRRAAEACAARAGLSLSRFVALALAEKIGARGAAEFFAERGKGGDPEWAVAFLEGRPG